MIAQQFLPTALIVIDVGAAIMYGVDGNWRMTVYWMAAAALTTVVTF